MLKKFSKFVAISSISAILLTGCLEDPAAPNGPGQVNISAALNNGFVTQALSALPNWSSGKVIITNIQFEYQGAETTIVKTVEAESTLDLSTGTANPPLPAVTLEPGLYKKAKFKVHLKPEALNFEINGTWQGNNIRIENDHQEDIHAKTEEFLVEPGKVYGVKIVVKPNSLLNVESLNDSTLQNATKDSNGIIVISKTSNGDIYNSYIKNNLDKISSFEQTIQ